MTQLDWAQKGREVVIHIPKNDNKVSFYLDEDLINYLAGNTPKTYFFLIEFDNEDKENTFFIDFENLKSVVSQENSLKITIGKKIKRKRNYGNAKPVGRYCIARGESFHERHLTENGWQHQRKYFHLYKIDDYKGTVDQPEEIKQKSVEQKEKVVEKVENQSTKSSTQSTSDTKSKLKECIKCQEIIPSQMDTCPYCKTNQNQQEEEDDSIDISI